MTGKLHKMPLAQPGKVLMKWRVYFSSLFFVTRHKKDISSDSRPRSFINWPIKYKTHY